MTTEKVLILLLRLSSLMLLLALGAVVMPQPWMDAVHQHLGMGPLPDKPIVGYLTRSVSAMYALHGALLLFVSFDVRRYLPVIRFLALAAIAFGLIMLLIDLHVGMPRPWTGGEGPFILLEGLVFYWLAQRVGREIKRTAGVPPIIGWG
jgi:hypothetical protein